jgi:hypothetical protein
MPQNWATRKAEAMAAMQQYARAGQPGSNAAPIIMAAQEEEAPAPVSIEDAVNAIRNISDTYGNGLRSVQLSNGEQVATPQTEGATVPTDLLGTAPTKVSYNVNQPILRVGSPTPAPTATPPPTAGPVAAQPASDPVTDAVKFGTGAYVVNQMANGGGAEVAKDVVAGGAAEGGSAALGGEGASLVTSEAGNAGFNAAAGESSQAAWNAGADAATADAAAAAETPFYANPATAGPLTAFAYLNNIYNNGGKQLFQGGNSAHNSAAATNTIMNVNPVTAWVNPVMKLFGMKTVGSTIFGKTGNKAHLARSESRKVIAENMPSVIEKSDSGPYHITNSDGSKTPMLDGKDVPAGQEGAGYNLDLHNPLSGQAAGYGDVLSTLILGGDQSGLMHDYTGYFGNAMLSVATDQESLRKEALFQFEKLGITFDQARQMIQGYIDQGLIPKDVGGAYINSLNVMEKGKGYTDGSVADAVDKKNSEAPAGVNRPAQTVQPSNVKK